MTLSANWQEVALRLIDREAGRGQDIVSDRTCFKRPFVPGDLTEREYNVERNRPGLESDTVVITRTRAFRKKKL